MSRCVWETVVVGSVLLIQAVVVAPHPTQLHPNQPNLTQPHPSVLLMAAGWNVV